MFDIEVVPKAKKQLKKISRLKNKHIVSDAIDELRHYPYAGKSLTREFENMYSLRVNGYRIIYKIFKKDKKIVVVKVGHRSMVYS